MDHSISHIYVVSNTNSYFLSLLHPLTTTIYLRLPTQLQYNNNLKK